MYIYVVNIFPVKEYISDNTVNSFTFYLRVRNSYVQGVIYREASTFHSSTNLTKNNVLLKNIKYLFSMGKGLSGA